MLILDTDHFSLLEWEESAEARRLRARLDKPGVEEPVTTIVSFEDQVRGWMSILAQAKNLVKQVQAYHRLAKQLKNYCAFKVLEFDDRAATEFQALKKRFPRIATMDLKIAAIALTERATLLSRNSADFGQIAQLRVEDWTQE